MGTSPIVMRINALLAEKGISKNQFYKDCKITSASFSLWNTGKTFPRENSLQRIADYLDTTTDYLRTGYGAKQVSTVAFAENLKKIMETLKITNYRLAQMFGCSQTSVANWISGERVPHQKTRASIASAFGFSLNELDGELPDDYQERLIQQQKSPAAEDRDGLDELDMELMARLKQLTPSEWAKVDAFVQGLLASR